MSRRGRRLKYEGTHMQRRMQSCKVYEKTRKGFLMRAYRNMKSRVLGIQKLKAHLYKGLAILPKNDFYEWSLADKSYNMLFDTWSASGYTRKLSPSIDRIDSTKGYEKGNIRWITHSQNSFLGCQSRHSFQTYISRSKHSA